MTTTMDEKARKEKEIQAAYKALDEELEGLNVEDIEGTSKRISEHFEKMNEMYPKVKKRLAGTAADARHLRKLCSVSKQVATRINAPVRFDLSRFLRARKRELGSTEALREQLHESVKKIFLVAPNYEFMYGAIQKEPPEVKLRVKRQRIDTQEDKNKVAVRAAERDLIQDCEQDTTPHEVEAIHKRVKQRVKRAARPQVSLIRSLVDPNSFSQTVENVFHMSFLVKEGKIGIQKDKSAMLGAITCEQAAVGSSQQRPTQRSEQCQQSILSFSMEDHKRWIQAIRSRPPAMGGDEIESV